MSLGGKCAFSTVMSLLLHMCILIRCCSGLCVLMALGMFMFVKVMSSLINEVSPSLFVSCIVMMSGWVLCTRLLSSSILYLMPFMLI